MTTAQIAAMQKRIGATPDGFWGPKSIAACQRHLRALMPIALNPWPKSDQASLRAFYGDPDDNSVIVSIPAPSWLRLYDSEAKVKTISCHAKVADSLIRALEAAYKVAPDYVRRYFGCHVDRNMRGGSNPSLHAYGAAIDLAASTNGNKTHWPTKADMPLEVMEAFASEGWMPAGAFWGRDAMHMQATR
jgi:hypothetical protein